jgi:hypothetical protein
VRLSPFIQRDRKWSRRPSHPFSTLPRAREADSAPRPRRPPRHNPTSQPRSPPPDVVLRLTHPARGIGTLADRAHQVEHLIALRHQSRMPDTGGSTSTVDLSTLAANRVVGSRQPRTHQPAAGSPDRTGPRRRRISCSPAASDCSSDVRRPTDQKVGGSNPSGCASISLVSNLYATQLGCRLRQSKPMSSNAAQFGLNKDDCQLNGGTGSSEIRKESDHD